LSLVSHFSYYYCCFSQDSFRSRFNTGLTGFGSSTSTSYCSNSSSSYLSGLTSTAVFTGAASQGRQPAFCFSSSFLTGIIDSHFLITGIYSSSY